MVDARPQFAIMRKNSILSSVTIQHYNSRQLGFWGKTYTLRIDKLGSHPNWYNCRLFITYLDLPSNILINLGKSLDDSIG